MSQNRALLVIDKDAMVSPDTKRRIKDDRQHVMKAGRAATSFYFVFCLSVVACVVLYDRLVSPLDTRFSQSTLVIIGLLISVGPFALWMLLLNQMHKDVALTYLPCPLCKQAVYLYQPWYCGNCKYDNNRILNAFLPGSWLTAGSLLDHDRYFPPKTARFQQLTSPLDGCGHPSCTHKDQTAFECPHCRRHIVIDTEQYKLQGSYQSPNYPYVATYIYQSPPPANYNPSAYRPNKDGSFFTD